MRWHWRRMASLKKKQKTATRRAIRDRHFAPPLLVTITRVGPRKLDDDNLASACKYVRDAIADVAGVDDGNTSAYVWRYEQSIGKYGVDVEITPL